MKDKNVATPVAPSATLTNSDFSAMRSHMLAFLIEDAGMDAEAAQVMVNHHRTLQRVFGPLVAWYSDQDNEEKKAKLLVAQEATAAFLNGGTSSVGKKLV